MTTSAPVAMAVQESSMVSVLIRAFAPLPSTLCVSASTDTPIASILSTVTNRLGPLASTSHSLRLFTLAGKPLSEASLVRTLLATQDASPSASARRAPISLELRAPMLGGKGGFGSMLRAQGGKMSSNRRGEENNDACRDLNGRRLSTVKQARQLAAYLATKEERERELSEAQQKKYAKLEKMLGRKPRSDADFVEAATKLDDQGDAFDDADGDEYNNEANDNAAGPSSSKLSTRDQEAKRTAGATHNKRDRIEDSEYLEQSRAIVDNVRSAVASAMLKKKRKLANSTSKPAPSAASSSSATSPSASKTAQKV